MVLVLLRDNDDEIAFRLTDAAVVVDTVGGMILKCIELQWKLKFQLQRIFC
jgi:hypothetical protein